MFIIGIKTLASWKGTIYFNNDGNNSAFYYELATSLTSLGLVEVIANRNYAGEEFAPAW